MQCVPVTTGTTGRMGFLWPSLSSWSLEPFPLDIFLSKTGMCPSSMLQSSAYTTTSALTTRYNNHLFYVSFTSLQSPFRLRTMFCQILIISTYQHGTWYIIDTKLMLDGWIDGCINRAFRSGRNLGNSGLIQGLCFTDKEGEAQSYEITQPR